MNLESDLYVLCPSRVQLIHFGPVTNSDFVSVVTKPQETQWMNPIKTTESRTTCGTMVLSLGPVYNTRIYGI
jgi:hypothetical protein